MRLVLFIILYSIGISLGVVAQTVEQKLDSLQTVLAKARPDTNKVWLLYNIAHLYFNVDPQKGIVYGEQALSLATQLQHKQGIASANKAIGRCYAVQNEYPEALAYFQTALTSARAIGDDKLEAEVLVSFGSVYNSKGEYDKGLSYLMQAKEVYERFGSGSDAHLLNSIASIYQKKKDNEKALQYYMEGIRNEENEHSNILATLYANAGGVHIILHEYLDGFKYLFKALAIQQENGNAKSAANTLNSIGGAYHQVVTYTEGYLPDSLKDKQVNLRKSIYYLKQAEELCKQLGRKDKLLYVYENLTNAYRTKGDYKQSLDYYTKYAAVKDSLTDIEEERHFAKIEAEFHVKQKTDSLKYLNALKDEELALSKTMRNGSMVMLALLGLVGVLFINRQSIKRKKLEAEKQLADNKLVSASHRLQIFTNSLKEKNELIENFSQEIERLQDLPCSHELPDTKENLLKLQNSIILTEEQWDDFKELFDQVHTGFLTRLREKLPELTPAETRFIALSKLNLSNKEMAGMLGIGASGMRNYKYRLRKKLDLADDKSLDELISNI